MSSNNKRIRKIHKETSLLIKYKINNDIIKMILKFFSILEICTIFIKINRNFNSYFNTKIKDCNTNLIKDLIKFNFRNFKSLNNIFTFNFYEAIGNISGKKVLYYSYHLCSPFLKNFKFPPNYINRVPMKDLFMYREILTKKKKKSTVILVG